MPTRLRPVETVCLLMALAAVAADGGAQSLSDTVRATFVVGSEIKLTVSMPSVSFPNADPDTAGGLVPNVEGPLTITAKGRTGAAMVLTVQASDDFRSANDLIPVGALTWTASGAGFVAGTMSKVSAQRLASWTNGGSFSGTQSYVFHNTWNYPVGVYGVTLTYSLSTP